MTQLQILCEDWLRLLPVGPYLVMHPLAVCPHNRLERAPLKPPHKQFGIVFVISNRSPHLRSIDQWPVRSMIVSRDRRREEPRDIRVPIGQTGCGEVQTCRDRALQHVPGRNNIARPEHGAVPLRAQIGSPRQNHDPSAVAKIPPEALVHRRGMKERIDIIKASAGADRENVLRRVNIRLCLIQPEVIEAVRLDIPVTNLFPEPLRRLGIGRVDVGSDRVPEVSRVRLPIRRMDEPSFAQQHVVELCPGCKVRPHAEQRPHIHRMQFTIHRSRIGPAFRIEVHLALARHVQEVHHDNVQRQIPLAISLRYIQNLFLGRVDRLALDVPINSPWQHMRHAGQQPIALVNFIAGLPGNDEIRHPVSNL